MSAQQLFHGSGEIHGPETGKNAGDDAGGREGGGIHQHGDRAGDPEGHGQLPGVVREGGQDADDPHELLREDAYEQAHDEVGRRSAGRGEQQARKAAGEGAAQYEPHDEDRPGLLPAQDGHGDERDDVCKSELHARHGDDGRDLRFGGNALRRNISGPGSDHSR